MSTGSPRTRRQALIRVVPAVAVLGAAALAAGIARREAGDQHDKRQRDRRDKRQRDSDDELAAARGGAPRLAIYRKGDAPLRPLPSHSAVRPGEVVQLAYVSAGRRFGVVASVDARGQVTLHLPEAPGQAAPLDGQGPHPVPSALELDDTPGFERFVFVTGDVPFSTEVVVEALRHGWLPRELDVREIVLQKRSPGGVRRPAAGASR